MKFDLVSPVDELARQIRLEFDFLHEARTMDAISQNLKVCKSKTPHNPPLSITCWLLPWVCATCSVACCARLQRSCMCANGRSNSEHMPPLLTSVLGERAVHVMSHGLYTVFLELSHVVSHGPYMKCIVCLAAYHCGEKALII